MPTVPNKANTTRLLLNTLGLEKNEVKLKMNRAYDKKSATHVVTIKVETKDGFSAETSGATWGEAREAMLKTLRKEKKVAKSSDKKTPPPGPKGGKRASKSVANVDASDIDAASMSLAEATDALKSEMVALLNVLASARRMGPQRVATEVPARKVKQG